MRSHPSKPCSLRVRSAWIRNNAFIVVCMACSWQGDGIVLISSADDLARKMQAIGAGGGGGGESVMQRYLPRLLLLDGMKFDIRLYPPQLESRPDARHNRPLCRRDAQWNSAYKRHIKRFPMKYVATHEDKLIN